jgi:release factor glutamine methyltransferase
VTTWRELAASSVAGSGLPASEVRRIVERASGYEGSDYHLGLDQPVPARAAASFAAMVERRLAGEPLQYVVGSWGFRRLDLFVDRRVLIPRPETEVLVEVALAELARYGRGPVAVDLGTGSGAIALSIAVESPSATVWATDASADALEVAAANVAGAGTLVGRRVRLAEGSWFDALPASLRGTVSLIVSNPPYIGDDEPLPSEVGDWEPPSALRAGPTGLEDVATIVTGALEWLLPRGGSLVVEIAPHQAADALALARDAGFASAEILPDLASRDRVLLARTVLTADSRRPRRESAVKSAGEALRAGLVVAVPTDTVYGVAVDPSVPGAIDRLFAVKHRPREVSIAVLVASPDDASRLAVVSGRAARLMARFWPGPLTIVFERAAGVVDLDLGGDPATVGVRCPDHDLVRSLAGEVGPLATTSANRHHEPTPTDAAGVAAVFGDEVAVVVDGGVCAGAPSTVVSVVGGELSLLREGRLRWAEILESW